MNLIGRIRQALELDTEQFPGHTTEMREAQLQQLLAALGGEQVVIPRTMRGKRGNPGPPADVLHNAYQDALSSNDQINKVAKRHGLSRATLYRLIKRGPPPSS